MDEPSAATTSGWFQIAWSAEIPERGVRPVRFFGHDLVAYRAEHGAVHLLDAHCLHLGAHLGHGGHVAGDDLVCPFHGWCWGPDGSNTCVPDQDRPNRAGVLRSWPVTELHGCVFAWHHPGGAAPSWQMPDMFAELPDDDGAGESEYYPPHPHGALRVEAVRVHPHVTADNAVDNRHFKYVHGTLLPELLSWTAGDHTWSSQIGFRSPKSGRIAAELTQYMAGLGIVITRQTGSMAQRVMMSTTPVDAEHSDLLLTTFLRRVDGDGDGTSEAVRSRYGAATFALPQDVQIWNHQRYLSRPLLASYEARPLGEFRRWTQRFFGEA